MKNLLGIILFASGFLVCTYAVGQVYDGKHAAITEPLDRVAAQHNVYYANVDIAGADEDLKSRDERYSNMTVPMNEANDRHFNVVTDYQTVEESSQTK